MNYRNENLYAINILECLITDMYDAMKDLSKKNPMYDVLDQRIKAIKLAQQALRNQKEE